MARAGEKLRAARERLGIDRGELSLRTKINERHLAAVEDSDFSSLPARIYAVGFARSYAGAVGLDAGVIAAQVRRELNEQEAPANQRPAYDLDLEDPAKIPSRRLAWIAAALGIALIVPGRCSGAVTSSPRSIFHPYAKIRQPRPRPRLN